MVTNLQRAIIRHQKHYKICLEVNSSDKTVACPASPLLHCLGLRCGGVQVQQVVDIAPAFWGGCGRHWGCGGLGGTQQGGLIRGADGGSLQA